MNSYTRELREKDVLSEFLSDAECNRIQHEGDLARLLEARGDSRKWGPGTIDLVEHMLIERNAGRAA
jgi:hypothetical protein